MRQQTTTDRQNPRYETKTAYHTRSWSGWLRQHLHDDARGRYIAFSLSTDYSQERLARRINANCPAGVFIFVLPAVSRMGVRHFHGLIRIPESASTEWSIAEIREHDMLITIRVPTVLKDFLWNPETWNRDSRFGNLHLRHDDASPTPRVAFLTFGSDAAESVLTYWSKTSDGEIRKFSEGEFEPHAHRLAVKSRTGRPPKPRVFTQQSDVQVRF